jgi:hypothetical protein
MWENSLKGRAVSIRPRSDRRIPPSRRGHQIVIAYCIDSREEHGQNEDMLPRRKRGCWMVSPVVCCWLVLLSLFRERGHLACNHCCPCLIAAVTI